MGSWDPSVSSFVDVKYVGTQFDGGKPSNTTCVTGFDEASFVFGTSSSLFNVCYRSYCLMDCRIYIAFNLLGYCQHHSRNNSGAG